MNPTISVITPTIRPKGLPLVEKALARQSIDFEWFIVSPFEPETKIGHWVQDSFTGGFWTLNRAYNKAIKQAKGELIVSWQDYTFAKPDALERFLTHYKLDNKAIVSGVGDKYEDDTFKIKTWTDPRRSSISFQPCIYSDIEFNFCSIPKQALIAIGGFDESLDFLGFGMDGFGVVDRLDKLGGWSFNLDQANESFSLGHGRPEGWEENNLIRGKYADKHKEYQLNPILSYL